MVTLTLVFVIAVMPFSVLAYGMIEDDGISEIEKITCTHEDSIVTNIVTYPTCLSEGFGNNFCTNCQMVTGQVKLDKVSHSYTGECKSNGDGTHSYRCVSGCNGYGNSEPCSGMAICAHKSICQVCKGEYGEINPENYTGFEIVCEVEATCQHEGHSAYRHCEFCKTDIGKVIYEQLPHEFGEFVSDNNATCLIDGTKTQICSNCGLSNTVVDEGSREKGNHNFSEWIEVMESTCSAEGTKIRICIKCGKSEKESISLVDHLDKNNDGFCDYCKIALEIQNSDNEAECTCNCHKSGFTFFIWKIGNFFHKIFHMDKYRECICKQKMHW